MLLLANFALHSINGSMATYPSIIMYHKLIPVNAVTTHKLSQEYSTSIQYLGISFLGYQEMTKEEEELELWNLVVEEATLLQEEESGYPVLDQETMKLFVSRISVEIQPEDYDEFYKTYLVY